MHQSHFKCQQILTVIEINSIVATFVFASNTCKLYCIGGLNIIIAISGAQTILKMYIPWANENTYEVTP